LQQALHAAEESGHKAGLAETEWNMAQLNFYGLNGQAALAHGQRAVALARELGLQDLTARSLNAVGYAALLLGLWAVAERYGREAQALFAGLGNRVMEVDSLSLVTVSLINDGRPQAGVQVGRQALAISREVENYWGQVNISIQLTPGLLDIGQYGEALALAQQATTLIQAHHLFSLLPVSLARLGSVYRGLLDLDAAKKALLEAKEANEGFKPNPFTGLIMAELGAVCGLAGQWDEAHTYAIQVLLAREGTLLYTGFTCWFEIEALLRAGQVMAATEHLTWVGQKAADNPRLRLAFERALAVKAQWDGELARAIEHLTTAVALAAEIGLPGEEWPIQVALGQSYRVCGDEEKTKQAFTCAATRVQALASRIEPEVVRARFLSAELVQRALNWATGSGEGRI
jgi:tetratricopeptide (TPR) repeat protein